MNQHKSIFIIGHPGAGKGLLAKTLAEKLGWKFVDADFGLEFNIGRNLVDIVGKQGADKFHDCESEILTTLSKENVVVATDGAVICSEENRNFLSSQFTVYVNVSTPVQLERISIKPMSLLDTDLKQFLDKLHQERDSLYEEVSSLSINSDDNALQKHVDVILEALEIDENKNGQLKLADKDLIFLHKSLHTPVRLTEQQAVCLKLLAQGKSSKEIANQMKISYRTVEGYIANTMELLGCSSSKELIALYHDKT